MNDAIFSSFFWSGRSLMGKMRSNLLMSVGTRVICAAIGSNGSNLPNFGFAAARTVVSQRSVAWTFAFEMVMVCPSSASCMAAVSSLLILSNSSMAHTP